MIEQKLIEQIEEWQTKWSHLQDLINDKIKNKDFAGAYRSQCESATLKRCIKDSCDIIAEGNTITVTKWSYFVANPTGEDWEQISVSMGVVDAINFLTNNVNKDRYPNAKILAEINL